MPDQNISFEAEVIEVKSRKAPSLDKVIRIVLETDQEEALRLQDFIAKDTVTIKVDDETR